MVNQQQLKGSWEQIKGKLKEKYGQLTDNDLLYSEGKEEELIGRIEQRTGKTKEEIKRNINEWLS